MLKKLKILILAPLMLIVTYSLCLFYSFMSILYLGVIFVTKYHTKFWIPKVRTSPPACLTSTEYGEHKYIRVNEIKLHYVEKGDKSKTLMLFIHGFPEFWYSWRHQIKEFSKDYWCVALDMRGYGDSDKPEGVSPYKVDNLTEDIRAVIQGLGREKCTLVCHDWGAVVGWNFIQNHMNMVDKYVMMGAPSANAWRKVMTSGLEQFIKSWYIFYFQMPRLPEFTISLNDFVALKAIGSGKTSDAFTENDLEAYKYTFSRPGALTGPINYYRANLSSLRVPKISKPKRYVPGLYILGENDLYISKETGPILEKEFENLKYEVIEGANHFVQQDAPEKNQCTFEKIPKILA